MNANIDDETTWLVQTLADDAHAPSAAVGMLIERLRRLEEEARLERAGRQTLQKIMSARRVLGDRIDFGRVEAPFAPE
jgi:hypothetical protein